MQEILEAIQADAMGDEIASLPIPESYRGAHVLRAEQEMFAGMESEDKDPRKSLHVGDIPTPEIAPDEVYLAVMASAINFNTVWTSIFEPLPTFLFLERYGKESAWAKRHDLPYQVVGSDASGVVLRVGPSTAPAAIAVARAAAARCGVDMHLSDEAVESESVLLARLATIAAERVRALTPVSDSLREQLLGLSIGLDTSPISNHGRIELARWLKEQAVSETTHRYGRLTGSVFDSPAGAGVGTRA